MGQPTRPTQPSPTLSGTGMSSISVARWMKLLAAVSPSSEYLYEGKADVVYLQVTTSERLVVEILTIGVIQVHFLSSPFLPPSLSLIPLLFPHLNEDLECHPEKFLKFYNATDVVKFEHISRYDNLFAIVSC